jgi:hypothetical protein
VSAPLTDSRAAEDKFEVLCGSLTQLADNAGGAGPVGQGRSNANVSKQLPSAQEPARSEKIYQTTVSGSDPRIAPIATLPQEHMRSRV